MPSPAANVLGTLGAICWSVQLLPQIILNHRRHHTEGLQPLMMLLWATAGIPLGVYNITQNFNIALQIQPQILTLLSLCTWGQCMYYGARKSFWGCVMMVAGLSLVMGGVEVGLAFALRSDGARRERGEWPTKLMGALAGLLLCAGVGRHYVDIWRERTVRGVSWLFCGIDALGDLTSLISVVLQGRPWDVLGMVVFASELVMWLGVFACGGWFNLRPWAETKIMQKRSAEGQAGVDDETSDTVVDAGRSEVAPRASSESAASCFRTASGVTSERTNTMRLRSTMRIEV